VAECRRFHGGPGSAGHRIQTDRRLSRKNFGKGAATAPAIAKDGATAKAETGITSLKVDLKNDWPEFGRDGGAQRYSPLAKINASNVGKLKLVWQYGIDARAATLNGPQRVIPSTEAVPVLIGNVLFTPTAQHTIVALEADTGHEIWKYDLGRAGAPLRGVTFWSGDAKSLPQIFAGSSDGKLIALYALDGKPVPGLGNEGLVNLRIGVADKFPNMPYHMSSLGVFFKDLIITGWQGQEDDPDGPAQDVRAWDVRTGKLRWTFSSATPSWRSRL
jgi:quinoprotein glucose dehydrogenase